MWWWWIASWAKDEQYKGRNNLLRRCVLVLGGCEAKDGMALIQDEVDPLAMVVASPIYRGPSPLPKY